jgi:hypothetical protein
MPEDDEKQEVETYKKNLDTKPMNKRIKRFRSPEQLADFLQLNAIGYMFLDGVEIKKKFPRIKDSAKKLDELMATEEFAKLRHEKMPDVTRDESGGMFTSLLRRYYRGQIELEIPHQKALAIFGQISGKYDPMQKMEIYDGHKLDAEKQKQVNDEVVNALLNKFKREQKEKEGTGNGKE